MLHPAILRRRRWGVNPLPWYAADGYTPTLLADYENETYYYDSAPSTFDAMHTFAATSNATVIDEDGVRKWQAHNLALNSATPATQSITVVSGADYTVEITGSGSVTLSNAGTGTVTAGSPVEITASTTTLTLTVTGSPSTMWAYRSDLGGMQNNPFTGDSYVPTTDAAVYMPRFDWSSGVRKLLVEPTAATNMLPESLEFSTSAGWVWAAMTATPASGLGMDGPGSATLIATSATAEARLRRATSQVTSTAYTLSIFVHESAVGHVRLRNLAAQAEAWFEPATGTLGTTTSCTSDVMTLGGGYFLFWMTATTLSSIGFNLVDVALSASDGSAAAVGDETALVSGVQLEAGSLPTSYIPTVGSPAPRAAETFSLNSAASDTLLGGDGVTLAMAGEISGTGTALRWYDDANNYITHAIDASGDVVFTQAASGTVDTATSAAAITLGANEAFSIAARHGANVIQGAVDGAANTANTTPTALVDNTGNALQVAYSGGPLRIAKIIGWNSVTSEAAIEEASSPDFFS